MLPILINESITWGISCISSPSCCLRKQKKPACKNKPLDHPLEKVTITPKWLLIYSINPTKSRMIPISDTGPSPNAQLIQGPIGLIKDAVMVVLFFSQAGEHPMPVRVVDLGSQVCVGFFCGLLESDGF